MITAPATPLAATVDGCPSFLMPVQGWKQTSGIPPCIRAGGGVASVFTSINDEDKDGSHADSVLDGGAGFDRVIQESWIAIEQDLLTTTGGMSAAAATAKSVLSALCSFHRKMLLILLTRQTTNNNEIIQPTLSYSFMVARSLHAIATLVLVNDKDFEAQSTLIDFLVHESIDESVKRIAIQALDSLQQSFLQKEEGVVLDQESDNASPLQQQPGNIMDMYDFITRHDRELVDAIMTCTAPPLSRSLLLFSVLAWELRAMFHYRYYHQESSPSTIFQPSIPEHQPIQRTGGPSLHEGSQAKQVTPTSVPLAQKWTCMAQMATHHASTKTQQAFSTIRETAVQGMNSVRQTVAASPHNNHVLEQRPPNQRMKLPNTAAAARTALEAVGIAAVEVANTVADAVSDSVRATLTKTHSSSFTTARRQEDVSGDNFREVEKHVGVGEIELECTTTTKNDNRLDMSCNSDATGGDLYFESDYNLPRNQHQRIEDEDDLVISETSDDDSLLQKNNTRQERRLLLDSLAFLSSSKAAADFTDENAMLVVPRVAASTHSLDEDTDAAEASSRSLITRMQSPPRFDKKQQLTLLEPSRLFASKALAV